MTDRLRTAIVTGAAQGLGEHIARRLARDGYHVVLADVSIDQARSLSDDLPSASAIELDVRDRDRFQQIVEMVATEWGTIDVLVNNAAVTPSASIWEINQEDWDDVLAVNLRSVLFGCQLVGPIMSQQRSGRIVNLSSLAGQQGGLVAGAHYAASKAGIIVLTKLFARALAPDHVTVNAIAPAAIDGPSMRGLSPEQQTAIATAVPVGRVGQPHEVAALVSFVCSSQAAFITGATLDVNGGLSMR